MWAWMVMVATRMSWYRLRTRYPRQCFCRMMAAQASFKAVAVMAFLGWRDGSVNGGPASQPSP